MLERIHCNFCSIFLRFFYMLDLVSYRYVICHKSSLHARRRLCHNAEVAQHVCLIHYGNQSRHSLLFRHHHNDIYPILADAGFHVLNIQHNQETLQHPLDNRQSSQGCQTIGLLCGLPIAENTLKQCANALASPCRLYGLGHHQNLCRCNGLYHVPHKPIS